MLVINLFGRKQAHHGVNLLDTGDLGGGLAVGKITPIFIEHIRPFPSLAWQRYVR